jgi:hypothetical protein
MQSTSKLLGSIDREVRSLSVSLDECAARLSVSYPGTELTVRRVPERVVLQAGDIGVTISFFRSRAGADASAEVVLAIWHGEVTFPGSAPRGGHGATQLSTQQFRIVASDDDASWVWMDEASSVVMTSRTLAATCIEAMAERLRSAAPDPM